MVNNKIKISELAKDFNLQGKDICAALTAMGKTYKPSQSVSTEEVGMLFDYLTQQHQLSSLDDVRATAVQAAEQRKQAAEDRIKKQQEEGTYYEDDDESVKNTTPEYVSRLVQRFFMFGKSLDTNQKEKE